MAERFGLDEMLRSGAERAEYRSSESRGEVVLHPKWSCWRYNLDGFALGFLSVFSWSSPLRTRLPSSQIDSASASCGTFGEGVYKAACFSLSLSLSLSLSKRQTYVDDLR